MTAQNAEINASANKPSKRTTIIRMVIAFVTSVATIVAIRLAMGV